VRAEDAASQDLAKMNGTWNIAQLDSFGVRKTEPKELQIGDGLLSMGGEKYHISLNTTTDPRQIDLKNADFAPQVFRGIYEFSDVGLRLSFGHWDKSADSPTARPRTFNAENPDYLHLKLQRP
jgi:uncharacterized protein (TIGR03067 family)